MKRFILFTISALFIGSTTLTFAAPTSGIGQHPHMHQVNKRLKNQMQLINKDLKSGRFTQDQAKNLKAGLKSIRTQEIGFFKLNGNKELTVDQQNQLNVLLDKNSAILGETQK